jgi:cyanophycinase-like exopeptidase
VATIVFKNRNGAYNPFVIDTIRNAEALFIAGGDQSDYVQLWKNTPVENAIDFVARKPAPVGGTSAGMAVMGEFLYSAMSNSSLTSAEALADPFHRDLTLVAVYRIAPGGRFDLLKWKGSGGIAYTLSAEAGVLTSSRGEIY